MGKKGKQVDSFKVQLSVRQETLEIDINDKLYIPSIDVLTPAKACNMMAENPALHARWNVLANEAAMDFDKEKMEFDIWVKERSKHYREDLADVLGGKRITDKMVEESVMTDPEYMRRYKQVLEKKKDAANIRSISFGFGERGERLVNIVSMMKSEKPSSNIRRQDDDDKNAFTDSPYPMDDTTED